VTKEIKAYTGIVIYWEDSHEYITLNLDDLGNFPEVNESLVAWKDNRPSSKFNLLSSVKYLEDGEVELTIIHDKRLNPEIGEDDTSWGKFTVTLKSGDTQGKIDWIDQYSPENSGERDWEASEFKLKVPIKKITTNTVRDQSKFRDYLLSQDKHCVITGERTHDTLQAAHIIPSKDGGPEEAFNGILLRADIHLLYDAEKFKIDPNGNIVGIDTENISNDYFKLLDGKSIPKETTQRIRVALARKWSSHQLQ